MANILGLIATVLMALATIFFLVGVATPRRGWFKLDGSGDCQYGTTGSCCFGNGFTACGSYSGGNDDADKLKNGGATALAFSIFAFLLGLVAIAWNLCTALGVGPGILQNGVIAAVLDAVCAVLSLIAWVVFIAVVKDLPGGGNADPHYSWVLSLIGTIFCVIAAVLIFLGKGGATAK